MTRNANGTWTLTDDEMNSLSIYANEAADRYSLQCMEGLANAARTTASTVYEQLKAAGFYG